MESLISIVIVNYNVKELLQRALQTIYQFSGHHNIEVLIVDNDSHDDSVQMVEHFFPQVKLIHNKKNAGFPKANNQAFHIAKGDYVFMLNPDTEFRSDAIGELMNYLEKHKDISLIAPKLLNTDGSLQKSVWRFPKVKYIFFNYFFMDNLIPEKYYSDKNWDQPFLAETVSGAAIFFRREIFNKIGYLDEKLFWIEDIDFCYRAVNSGLKLLYYPKVELLHHIGGSAKKNYNISLSNQIFNKVKFFRKHHPGAKAAAVTWISFIHVILKTIVLSLLSPFQKIYFRKAKAYWYTLPRVFNPPEGIK